MTTPGTDGDSTWCRWKQSSDSTVPRLPVKSARASWLGKSATWSVQQETECCCLLGQLPQEKATPVPALTLLRGLVTRRVTLSTLDTRQKPAARRRAGSGSTTGFWDLSRMGYQGRGDMMVSLLQGAEACDASALGTVGNQG